MYLLEGFLCDPVVKNLPCNAGEMGWSLIGELRSYILQGS